MNDSSTNKLVRTLARLSVLPERIRRAVLSKALGRFVRFVGTAGVRFEVLSQERVIASLSNHGAVQNHIKGVHAAAMALLAETVTGFAVAMHLPDDKLPLIKTMRVDFLVRAQGALRAEAFLKPEQIELIRTTPKGDVTVAVVVTDESGGEPIKCEMVWAWIPKKKP